ncbi:PEP-CTERM sorting domain-containing protein [Roseimicrobium gellanilyticum]|uniref:PEP-CTERM sorting domain-containing protein n=1 Tax=Roseimicrobium gellanilyticum TaxID=748857 RepID=UPI001B869BD5|nr:PEP-CTERM sorting domain-containing protein [Roseimicrobium gellanilyticum]
MALTLLAPASLWAQSGTSSSYFMLQGPLGPGGAYVTEKFRVEYTGLLTIPGYQPAPPGSPQPLVNSGEALLVSIFGNGVTVPSGTYTNSVGTVEAGGGFLSGFQLSGGGMVYPGPWPFGAQWNYFVSGGSYENTFADPVEIGNYPDATWTWSYTGMSDRYLEDGSIDAWSYAAGTQVGEDEWGPIMVPPLPSGVQPTLADFSGPGYMETLISGSGLPYSVYRISAVPEPGRAMLLLVGAIVIVARRSRRKPVWCMG